MGELENARVLIVGADKMTRLLLTHMASHGAVGRKCTILNRSYQRAKDMADEYKEGYDVDIDVVASNGDEQVAYDLAKDADIIFTASSAVDYIFDAENVAKLERQAGREKLMLVDIAVSWKGIPPNGEGRSSKRKNCSRRSRLHLELGSRRSGPCRPSRSSRRRPRICGRRS